MVCCFILVVGWLLFCEVFHLRAVKLQKFLQDDFCWFCFSKKSTD